MNCQVCGAEVPQPTDGYRDPMNPDAVLCNAGCAEKLRGSRTIVIPPPVVHEE